MCKEKMITYSTGESYPDGVIVGIDNDTYLGAYLSGYIDFLECPHWNDDIKVIANVEEHDYQGDGIFLLQMNDRYCFHVMGYGSCSGCDYLEDISFNELSQHRQSIKDDESLWFDSIKNMLQYIETKDWSTDYLSEYLVDEFVEKVKDHIASTS